MPAWLAPVVGAAVGLYGANKQSNAAKDAQQANNEAADAQYKYNVQRWETDKQKMLADREYKVREIEQRAANEGQLAAFKDASNARQYNYQLQIRNSQQDTNERMFAKSNAIYQDQLGLNALQEKNARQEERQQLAEIQAEKRYEQNTAYIDGLLAEGEIRARGQTGRSVQKARSVNTLKTATALTLLNLSLDNATAASQNAIKNIRTDRTVADLNAFASKMLDPGELPMPLEPLATPMATFMYPRVYEDYDFGPEPIRGAQISPSSAAAQVWGSSITSLAGAASSIVKAFNT
tara:strand:+ start:279 stop:1157 length:879 start_codon:yes stop_codon:yes gene_type:complete